ncbi:MAG: PadR family transcriptional regulator [Acholeplasmataceae bacterium]|nr:PadR family transcriptional regulator [Acholeplasmataceae bacterium]
MNPQLKKGFLETLVLAAIKEEPSYGYKIIQDVSEVLEISESTLYPILKRLETQGFVTTYFEEHQSRLRKYYKITVNGLKEIDKARDDFNKIESIYRYIMR